MEISRRMNKLQQMRCFAAGARAVVAVCAHHMLATRYGVAHGEIAAAIRGLADARNVSVNRAAVDAGLMVLEAGGDLADGVIAFEGV
jgi:hypothetical protein